MQRALISAVSASITGGFSSEFGVTVDNQTLRPLASTDVTQRVGYAAINTLSRTGVDVGINGVNVGSALVDNLRSNIADQVQSVGSSAIGKSYFDGGLSYVEHKLSHAALGGASASIYGGNIASGALGASVAEATGEAAFGYGINTATVLDIAKISGASSGLLTGDVNTAANSANLATENNLFPFLIGVSAYTLLTGEGDPRKGIEKIGAREDLLLQGIEKAMERGVELSYQAYPKETQLILETLEKVSDAGDAIVEYADVQTGEVVSKHWNSLSLADRNFLKGSMTILTVIIPATKAPLIQTKKGSDVLYDSLATRNALETKHGASNIVSTTVPPTGSPNIKLAGKRHPVTGIVFDNKGFPIFDDIAKFDTKIPVEIALERHRITHFKAATSQLSEAIEKGQVNRNLFTEKQLKQIQNGDANIAGLTWHHHQDTGRLQLIAEEIHEKTGHVGGYKMLEGK